jgi:hypothetical protein
MSQQAQRVFAYKGAWESLTLVNCCSPEEIRAANCLACDEGTGLFRVADHLRYEHLFMARSALHGANSGNKSRACYCCRSKRLDGWWRCNRQSARHPSASVKINRQMKFTRAKKVAFGCSRSALTKRILAAPRERNARRLLCSGEPDLDVDRYLCASNRAEIYSLAVTQKGCQKGFPLSAED